MLNLFVFHKITLVIGFYRNYLFIFHCFDTAKESSMNQLFLEKLLDCLLNQVAVIERNMNILYKNQAFEAFISLVQKETTADLRKSAKNVFSESLTLIYESLKECFKNGSVIQKVLALEYMGTESYFKFVLIPNYNNKEVESCILILYNITDVELKKKEMNHQIQFFSRLINRLPIGVYMFDIHSSEVQMTLWNPMMDTYFSKKEKDVLGLPFEQVFDKNTVKLHYRAITMIDETGLYYDYPAEIIKTPKGNEYFHIILTPIIDKEQSGSSYIGIIENVTKKIQQEEKLKEFQKELKIALKNKSKELNDTTAEISSILDNSYGISIFSLDKELRYRVFNSHYKFQIQVDFDIEIHKGMSFKHILSILPDQGSEINLFLNNALAGTNTSTEIFYDLPGNERTYLDAVFSPLFSQNEIIGVTVILIDTTHRRHLEREAEIFKKVADNADYGVLLTDLEYNVRYMNSYWEKIFLLGSRNFLNTNISEFIPPPQMKQIIQALEIAQNSGISQQLELDLSNSQGKSVTILMNCVLYKEIDGEPAGIAFTFLDITPMRQARETLIIARNNAEKSSLLKSSFVANMSHEIRTPLNAILGFAELLDGKAENQEIKNYVGSILSSGFILKGLINDILDFSKIEAGKMTIVPAENRIDTFLKDLFEMFRLQAKQKNLYFEVRSVSSIPDTLVFDPTKVRQILLNLLGNAIKFTKWGYIKLLVQYDVINKKLIFAVSDTGIGIDRKNRRDIFNPFEQQENQDARHFEGTGLGLAITNKLVFLMKGSIHLSSDPWKGSQFTIEIPMKRTGSSELINLHMAQDNDLPSDQLECYAEEDLLSDSILNLAAESVHFIPLKGDSVLDGTFETSRPCILTSHPHRYEKIPQAVLIEVVNEDHLPDKSAMDSGFFICSDLKDSKKLAVIKSILLSQSNQLDNALFTMESLSESEIKNIEESIKTRDFTEIEAILPLLNKCGESGASLVAEIRKYLDTFDIQNLNMKMEQLSMIIEKWR